jgi:2-C-methyl-D-erythritol 4-phosphate cytidylyltransferase
VNVCAVIVAGGSGARLGREGGKQVATAGGRPILATTLEAFEVVSNIDSIVVVCAPGREEEYGAACGAADPGTKVAAVVPGGETRQDSVSAGVAAAPAGTDVIAVHDGARPLVPPAVIDEAVEVLRSAPSVDGVVVGHPVFDTIKEVGRDGADVVRTVDRSALWAAQTPQVFTATVLREALAAAARDGFLGTDDAVLVERIGGKVRMLAGPRSNLKVTVPEDLAVVDAVLRARHETRES